MPPSGLPKCDVYRLPPLPRSPRSGQGVAIYRVPPPLAQVVISYQSAAIYCFITHEHVVIAEVEVGLSVAM